MVVVGDRNIRGPARLLFVVSRQRAVFMGWQNVMSDRIPLGQFDVRASNTIAA